jgi:hypothetical protein
MRFRAKVIAAAKADESARLAAERDNAKARGLQQMMDNTLQHPDKGALTGLVREPWMDMPLQQMNKQQREAVKSFERLVQDHEEQKANARRTLEAERKTIEADIVKGINTLNNSLCALHLHFLDVCTDVAVAQQQSVDIALLLEASHDTDSLEQQSSMGEAAVKQDLTSLHHALKTAIASADATYGRFLVRAHATAPTSCMVAGATQLILRSCNKLSGFVYRSLCTPARC